jgi:hypothetical protein
MISPMILRGRHARTLTSPAAAPAAPARAALLPQLFLLPPVANEEYVESLEMMDGAGMKESLLLSILEVSVCSGER